MEPALASLAQATTAAWFTCNLQPSWPSCRCVQRQPCSRLPACSAVPLPLMLQVSGYSERNTWVRDPPQVTRVTRDQIVESVERSLQRLQTEHIDLLQVHWWVHTGRAGGWGWRLKQLESCLRQAQLPRLPSSRIEAALRLSCGCAASSQSGARCCCLAPGSRAYRLLAGITMCRRRDCAAGARPSGRQACNTDTFTQYAQSLEALCAMCASPGLKTCASLLQARPVCAPVRCWPLRPCPRARLHRL